MNSNETPGKSPFTSLSDNQAREKSSVIPTGVRRFARSREERIGTRETLHPSVKSSLSREMLFTTTRLRCFSRYTPDGISARAGRRQSSDSCDASTMTRLSRVYERVHFAMC